jgi:hypothetical protein
MITTKKNNIYIKMANPLLERLWDVHYPHISQQKNHYVPCNM